MNIKNFIAPLLASLVIATSAQAGAAPETQGKHYMMHGGDGPQGHMMKGAQHSNIQGNAHKEDMAHSEVSKPKQQHYMMHGGDGPQGHMMDGAAHPTGKSTAHSEYFGTVSPTNGRHYMMLGGDGPQGYWMKGDTHQS